jgi:hypothetical protein
MDNKIIREEDVLVVRCEAVVNTYKALGDMRKNDPCKESMKKLFLDLAQDVHEYALRVLKKNNWTVTHRS